MKKDKSIQGKLRIAEATTDDNMTIDMTKEETKDTKEMTEVEIKKDMKEDMTEMGVKQDAKEDMIDTEMKKDTGEVMTDIEEVEKEEARESI